MASVASSATPPERELLELAQAGDERAYDKLVELHRNELHAHCYRMLGSVHDADDALQDAFLRAWRFLPRFDGRGSLKSWLYKISTNASLDVINRRPKRTLPIDYAPSSGGDEGVGPPLVETIWIEPYPDDPMGLPDGLASPDVRYEQRESLELAFIAAVQHLPANQRAVLLMREVLGFSAQECADALETSVASVNSALQRARKSVDDRLPAESQQQTLRALGDDALRDVVENYMDAMEAGDVDRVVSMLAEDAAWSMPPLTSWFRGADVRGFLENGPLSGKFRWKHLPVRMNGQAAVACYTWHDEADAFLPFAIDVLTLRGNRIAEVTAFIARPSEVPDLSVLPTWPDAPPDPQKVADYFTALGLPERLR